MDLYLPEAYHVYGSNLYEHDEIAAQLEGGGWEHEWITEPLLISP